MVQGRDDFLDVDGTVKPLYGRQELALRGYNPTKHGRPSHVYQTYFIAAIRMVLDLEVQPGQPDGIGVCAARIMGLARATAARAMAAPGAGRHRLGH